MAKPDPDFLTQVVLDAVFSSDQEVADKYRISPRTVRNYRKAIQDQPELAALFLHKKALREQAWANEIPQAVRAGLEWLGKSIPSLSPSAENVYAVTGAVKILAEIDLSSKLIQDRLDRIVRQLPPPGSQRNEDEDA